MNSVTLLSSSPALYTAPTRNTSAQALIADGSALTSSGGGSATSALPTVNPQGGASQAQPALRPAPINNAADADYNGIVSNLQDGNLNLAQAEYTKLQIDLTQRVHHVQTVGGSAVPLATEVSAASSSAPVETSAVSGGARFSITV
jgi:hypothetical protein